MTTRITINRVSSSSSLEVS